MEQGFVKQDGLERPRGRPKRKVIPDSPSVTISAGRELARSFLVERMSLAKALVLTVQSIENEIGSFAPPIG